jgi:hypothetical protein
MGTAFGVVGAFLLFTTSKWAKKEQLLARAEAGQQVDQCRKFGFGQALHLGVMGLEHGFLHLIQ